MKADGIEAASLRGQVFLGSEAFVRRALARLEGDRPSAEIPLAQRRPLVRPLADYAKETTDRAQAMARAYASGAYKPGRHRRPFRGPLQHRQPGGAEGRTKPSIGDLMWQCKT
ncbi:MAG: hypothetical protein QGH73_02370 [Rhodospirillales bacterium]|jgi:hypothetical protein|nr:hypothetical protein [Rhodospirillaceae bacterium]MDP6840501.1 hypothetical protein [Rhodospirillales bacterium]|tara:strand:- start:391 stop:729 length:339 start_codon:yes stop_codon:yes gene_type:complete